MNSTKTDRINISILFSSLRGRQLLSCLALRPPIGPNALPMINQKPYDKGEGLYHHCNKINTKTWPTMPTLTIAIIRRNAPHSSEVNKLQRCVLLACNGCSLCVDNTCTVMRKSKRRPE